MLCGRRIRAAAVAAVVIAAALASVPSTPASAAPGEDDTPIANPDLTLGCGLDILVMLDESGSIESAHATDEVEDAFKAFTRGLQNTGSRMAVAEFSTVARLPLSGAAQSNYTTVTTDSIADVFDPYIERRYDPFGGTNWEDGFRAGRYFLPRPDPVRPHLAVFITDGNPTDIIRNDRVTYDPGNPSELANEYENEIPLDDSEVASTDNNAAKNRAVPNANAIKAQGSHILSVAVGSGLSSASSLDRIKAVSGPNVFRGIGSFDITTDDVYRVPRFDDLEAAMRDAAFGLCAPSVNVQKLVDLTPDPGPDDLVPDADWELTATASPAPSDWVLPAGATGDTAVALTGPDGFATFQWSTVTETASEVTVDETVQAGFVNDQSATECAFRTPDQPGDEPLPITTTNGGFSATVPPEAVVTCQLVNRIAPAPAISLVKSTNGPDANTPAEAPFVPVGDPVQWTYELTNTGNATLSDIAVTDDQGVTITCPVDTLAPEEVTICTGSGTAVAGLYTNLGTVTATDPFGTPVADTDPSHYVGSQPGIDIEKSTNGADADLAPGPFVDIGDPVSWTYTVTNTGTEALSSVAVVDSDGVTITCPGTTLAISTSMSCTAAGTAVAGQYENLASVAGIGDATSGIVQDSDASHYFGADAAIDVEKSTNGVDADTVPEAPFVATGDPVAWVYKIQNTGNVPLLWSLVDDQVSEIACPSVLILRVGRSITCQATGMATPGLYANLATVEGTGPGAVTAADTDLSHYFGVVPAIHLEKFTNGTDANEPPGPFLAPGSAVTWTYAVTNTGNAPLEDVIVLDLHGVPVSCPQATLPAGGSMDCAGTGTAAPNQYTNFALVVGSPPAGLPVFDYDPSHYFGAVPGIHLETMTNGVEADEAPGPYVPVGDPVDWSYVVTNSGNDALSDIAVVDDRGVTVTCPATDLAVGEEMTCTAAGVASEGQYENLGTVTATDALDGTVSDTDPSHYFGSVSALELAKHANGEDADVAPGIEVPFGPPVTMTFVVSNPGNIAVGNVEVTDDRGLVPVFVGGDENDDELLQPGEEWTYSVTTAPATGQNLDNVGTVTGLDVLENSLTATDPANVHTALAVAGAGTGQPEASGSLAFSGARWILFLITLGVLMIAAGVLARRRLEAAYDAPQARTLRLGQ